VSGNTLLLEAALVHTHPEVTVETPTGTPGVGNDPVGSGTLLTPTDNLDGMTTELVARGVSVDTRSVGHEVRVDDETGLDGTVGVDFLLDSRNSSEGAVRTSLVLLVSTGSSARSVASTSVSTTGSVGVTGVGDDTSSLEVLPGLVEVTTLTSHVRGVTSDHVLWREDDVVTTFDTGSVGKNLGGGESPAGTTSLLVSDCVHAAWPLVDGVERGWEGDVILEDLSFLTGGSGIGSDDGTEEEFLDLGFGQTGELVLTSDPVVLHVVDLFDLFWGTNVGTIRDGDKRQAK